MSIKGFLSFALAKISGGYDIFALPDHDLGDLLRGPSATAWRHRYVCTECNTPTGHQEYMTRICRTCGRKMHWSPSSRAIRYVIRGGKWVRQQTGNVTLLECSRGKWVTSKSYDRCRITDAGRDTLKTEDDG